MRCSCATMSLSDTSLVEEEGADVDGADQEGAKRDGVEQEGGVVDSCRDLNCASLRFMIAASMAQI